MRWMLVLLLIGLLTLGCIQENEDQTVKEVGVSSESKEVNKSTEKRTVFCGEDKELYEFLSKEYDVEWEKGCSGFVFVKDNTYILGPCVKERLEGAIKIYGGLASKGERAYEEVCAEYSRIYLLYEEDAKTFAEAFREDGCKIVGEEEYTGDGAQMLRVRVRKPDVIVLAKVDDVDEAVERIREVYEGGKILTPVEGGDIWVGLSEEDRERIREALEEGSGEVALEYEVRESE